MILLLKHLATTDEPICVEIYVQVPPSISLDHAALLQPLSCIVSGYYSIDLHVGQNVLIQGLGVMGSLWAAMLHFQGKVSTFFLSFHSFTYLFFTIFYYLLDKRIYTLFCFQLV